MNIKTLITALLKGAAFLACIAVMILLAVVLAPEGAL